MDSVAEVGKPAPEFELNDLEGRKYRLDRSDDVVVLDFWSANCPWSEESDARIKALLAGQPWADRVQVWRIASNADEALPDLRRIAAERQVTPVLPDVGHRVADLYGAQTTPHFYVIDPDRILRYMGAPDDSTWRTPEPTRSYLRPAIEAALSGQIPETTQTPGRGCTIVRHQPKVDDDAQAN
jgi:peroxiredoxin